MNSKPDQDHRPIPLSYGSPSRPPTVIQRWIDRLGFTLLALALALLAGAFIHIFLTE